MLKAIPSALITCEEPGLIGCVAVAERLMRRRDLFRSPALAAQGHETYPSPISASAST